VLGEGVIYATPEAEIIESHNPLSWPGYWKWGYGIDLGISHPWACALMCWDPDADTIHVVATLRAKDLAPDAQVSLMRGLEKRLFNQVMDFPVAYPHDAGTRDRGSGEPIKRIYKQFGLRMMAKHATHAGQSGVAALSLEAGIAEIDLRERCGKLKVDRCCLEYLEERRQYHRHDGEPVKVKDDTLAAVRYGIMMRRFFRPLDDCTPLAPGRAVWPPSNRNRGVVAPRNSRAALPAIRMGTMMCLPSDYQPRG